ncbi:Metallo-hydrolase oxidoreductase [Hygrophoropsis aurantiaca]|uniref:Metallo-hydrolase oxidoreductase n=1 Tax=Hygrophoropsis aurantiaca TaxID=72124 RepID=A0ACB8ADB1_9AGAM|nr:Metallo-hydrolase oxidoreductase [Hygrophoropsis aurantiaca]
MPRVRRVTSTGTRREQKGIMLSSVELAIVALAIAIFPVICILLFHSFLSLRSVQDHDGPTSCLDDDVKTMISSHQSERRATVTKMDNLPAFTTRRLTGSTFLITEWDDIWNEHPFIYIKIVPTTNTILVADTGCGGKTHNPAINLTSLREYIETVGVADNEGKPLNENGTMKYVVVQTHCHYDHILGAEEFAVDSPVLASGHSPSFVSPENMPHHSQCNVLGIRTPSYALTLVPHLHQILSGDQSSHGLHLGVQVFHIPGHTPDELALWDAGEMMLYVGDTLYEYDPIIFPNEGNIDIWFSTMDWLIAFVKSQSFANDVKINCGHATAMGPALEVLQATRTFMADVISGKVELWDRYDRRGYWTVEYRQEGGRFSLICPERLVLEARKAPG